MRFDMRSLKTAALAAALALAPMAASAITVTMNAPAIVEAVVEDETFTTVQELGGADTVLSLGSVPSMYFANIDVLETASAFAVEQTFRNDSNNDRILTFATLNPSDTLVNADLQISLDGGATFFSLGVDETTVSVGAGSEFIIMATAEAATGPTNFDYTISAVPLPAGGLLLLTALGGLGLARRKRKAA